MLALEKILSSFIMLPGLLWLIWLILTMYLFRRGQSIVVNILSLVSLILMYVVFTALGTGVLVVPLENMYSGNINIDSYEQRYPIVVLGGGINYSKDNAYLSPYSLQRVVKGYEIYREIKAPIIFSGGIAIDQEDISEAEIAADCLAELGVKKEDIIIEDKARTTYENGVYIKRWLSSERKIDYQENVQFDLSNSDCETENTVYLITNALHLPRSILVFEKQGINVIPVSSGIIIDHRSGWLNYLPNRKAFTANMMAVHEWLGLAWYKITKRI